ncbi:MAG TPA: hypothetical protein PK156_15910 [Polyangium sp.]|nr:hypothetical protein [Polyangium sp.]
MVRAIGIGIGLGLACFSMTFGALAQDEAAAKALFDRGIAARDRGEFATGCPDLAESHRLASKLGTLFQLAKCEHGAGKIASADVHFHQFITGVRALDLDKQPTYDTRVHEAEEARKSFVADIPTLTLVLPRSAPTNIEVVRDGTKMTSVMLGVAIPVDPGEHRVTTQVPNGPAKEHRFTIERKEAKRVELQFISPRLEPVVETNTTSEKNNPNSLRTGGFVVLGVGVAGLLTWGIGGLVAKNDMSTVEEVCPKDLCPSLASTTQAREAWNRGATAANVASVGFGVGIVGAVVGSVMLIGSTRGEKAPPRKSAFFFNVGPTGGSFGIKGVVP